MIINADSLIILHERSTTDLDYYMLYDLNTGTYSKHVPQY